MFEELIDELEVTSSEELEDIELESLEVGVDSVRTNEEVVSELQSKEKTVAKIGYEMEKGYPLFEIRLTPESQMSTVTMDAIQGLISTGVKDKRGSSDFERESELGTKPIEVCLTVVLAVDPNAPTKEKVIGYFKREKLRHLYQLTRNLEHKFYLDEQRVFSGQTLLAII